MRWLFLAAAGVFAVAAVSTWFAFQRPDFVAGLAGLAAAAAWQAFAPKLFKRMPPEEEKAWRDRQRRAQTGKQDR